LSLERVLKILENLGLPRTDAEMYVYLAKKGPKGEQDLFRTFKMTDTQLRSSLSSLQNRGLVTATVESSVLFSAVEFGKALELLIKINIEHIQTAKEEREFLKIWRPIGKRDLT
jgi:sugar-specific transcriptional regulator TrmB